MNVQAIMTSTAFAATRHATMAEVAKIMADQEVGAVPIVDADGQILGILTDRDLCKAMVEMDKPASEISALQLASKPVLCCRPDQTLEAAMKTMRDHHIRRLPVVDKAGKLAGILSIDDVVLRSEAEKESSHSTVSFGDAVLTLKAIYGSRTPKRPRVAPA